LLFDFGGKIILNIYINQMVDVKFLLIVYLLNEVVGLIRGVRFFIKRVVAGKVGEGEV
jgi:hypothetical protein